jgi:GMP synthase-like glutamine amidotransferase
MTRSTPWVELIVSEHRSYLSQERTTANSELAEQLEAVSGYPVHASHYLEVDRRARPPVAVVLSGSVAPWATYEQDSLERLGDYVWATSVPTMGICAGMQLLATFAGGRIARAEDAEFGYLEVEILAHDDLFTGLGATTVMYQEHTDRVSVMPAEFDLIGRSRVCAQAFRWLERGWWGTQFHPERADASHPDGAQVLWNFFDLALGRSGAGQTRAAGFGPLPHSRVTGAAQERRHVTGREADGMQTPVASRASNLDERASVA